MNEPTSEQGLFIVVVGAIIEDVTTGNILMLKRSPDVARDPGIWEDPAGRVHQHEDPETALHREIKEECGLDVAIVKPINVFHEYRAEGNKSECIGVIYWCQAEAQQVRLSHEHCDYRWIRPADALELVEHSGVQADIRAYLREAGGNLTLPSTK